MEIKKQEELAALSLDVAKEDLVKDKKFVLEHVYFDSGKADFLKESDASLFVLLTFLEENSKVKIEKPIMMKQRFVLILKCLSR